LVNDVSGVGETVGNFPYFYFDLDGDGCGGYPSGQSEFRVELGLNAGDPVSLAGEDLPFEVLSAEEDYDPAGQPASYPDRNGTFVSPFDGTIIAYSYTNVGYSSPQILTGNFSFSKVPEPSSSVMLLAGFGFLMIRRKR